MPIEMPENLFNRSKGHGTRADAYGKRVDNEIAGSSRATRATDISWARTRNQMDEFLATPLVAIGSIVGFAIGITLFLFSVFNQQGALFIISMPLLIVGGVLTFYIGKNMSRAGKIDQALLDHNLTIDMMQENAVNTIRSSFTAAEMQLAATQAGVEVNELHAAMVASVAMAQGGVQEREESFAVSSDIRQKSHELSLKEKDILLEEAKGRLRVDELVAQAEAGREEIRVRHDLDLRELKETLFAEQERFDLEMKKLDNQNNQAAKMQRINEVTQLRKVLVASHAELRNNPALADQLSTMISEVNLLAESMQKKEPLTPEDYQRQQMIDQMITRFVLKRHGLDDDRQVG